MNDNQKLVLTVDRADAEGLLETLRWIRSKDEARTAAADALGEMHFPALGFYADQLATAIEEALGAPTGAMSA